MITSRSSKIVPTTKVLNVSIRACVENSEKILEDVDMLLVQEPLSRQVALSIIVQEACAKAFLLIMVRDEVIPWSPLLLRAMNDHSCKQLVGVIMEYVDFQWDAVEELKSRISYEVSIGDSVPSAVADAMDVFRYEKMGRWESKNWEWADPPDYDKTILHIASGRRDQMKQDTLYVRIARDGSVVSTPTKIAATLVREEVERAKRYVSFLNSLNRETETSSITYSKVKKFLAALFEGKK